MILVPLLFIWKGVEYMFERKPKEEILPSYEDEKGEYVFLVNQKTGKEEKHYVRDLVISAFGNADEYDKRRMENK